MADVLLSDGVAVAAGCRQTVERTVRRRRLAGRRTSCVILDSNLISPTGRRSAPTGSESVAASPAVNPTVAGGIRGSAGWREMVVVDHTVAAAGGPVGDGSGPHSSRMGWRVGTG